MFWEIRIRMVGEEHWRPIWSACGGDAEGDARKRYEGIVVYFDTGHAGPLNRHARRWGTVCLLRNGEPVAEHERRLVDTLPPPKP
jgi:hypothetical protein